jgi:hypothetical protein
MDSRGILLFFFLSLFLKFPLQAVDEQAERERTEVYSHEETTRERTAHAPEKVSIFYTE